MRHGKTVGGGLLLLLCFVGSGARRVRPLAASHAEMTFMMGSSSIDASAGMASPKSSAS